MSIWQKVSVVLLYVGLVAAMGNLVAGYLSAGAPLAIPGGQGSKRDLEDRERVRQTIAVALSGLKPPLYLRAVGNPSPGNRAAFATAAADYYYVCQAFYPARIAVGVNRQIVNRGEQLLVPRADVQGTHVVIHVEDNGSIRLMTE